MKNIITLLVIGLLSLTGCSTYIANAPFGTKSVSDDALEASGLVEYKREVKVTPTKALIPVISTNADKSVSVKMIPPELIVAGGEAAAKIIVPAIKTTQESYVDLRGAAQIEVTETYKHISK